MTMKAMTMLVLVALVAIPGPQAHAEVADSELEGRSVDEMRCENGCMRDVFNGSLVENRANDLRKVSDLLDSRKQVPELGNPNAVREGQGN